MKTTIEKALARAQQDRDEGGAAWVPVFADVVLAGEKIGHITSDGYTNKTWQFYPKDERRRFSLGSIDDVLPKWAAGALFENPQTYREKHQAGDVAAVLAVPGASMRTYNGRPESDEWRHVGDCVVMAGGALDAEQFKLDPRLDLSNHSPTGFAWGYYGSGPAQLALAILADASGDDALALKHYQAFKSERIAALPRGEWKITFNDVRDWLAAREKTS